MKNSERLNGFATGVLKSAVNDDAGSCNSDFAPCIGWSEMGRTEHFVQFYESDDFLVESLGAFIGSGLGAGEGAIVIATQAHREALAERLRAQGIDLDAVQSRGQFVSVDAAEILSRFMVHGSPDEALFTEVIGGLLEKTARNRRSVRAFGEMVALLWADGNGAAAIHLEELWNRLGKTHSFSLFCAYPMSDFADESNSEPFLRICKEHSHVLPVESYSAKQSSAERLRTIAVLQQKAASLEAEIAKHRETVKTLARREQELRDFLENATEGIHQVGPDGTILWANKAELELLGYTPEEYIGHPITEFHADPEVIQDILERLHRGEKLRDCEARLKHKDGSVRCVSINSSVYWEGDRFVHTRCFTRDITAQKSADEAGRLLRAIVESSDDAIVSKDLTGVITSWNKGAEHLFGYTEAEVIGKPITILMPEERINEEPAILQKICAGERVEHYETVRRRKNGTLVDVSLTVSPINDGTGRVVGASKIVRDNTEKIRAKEKLEQTVAERTAQLRDTVAELEAFSYSIAHDMRAPLRAMTSFSRLLREDFSENLPATAKDYIRRIAVSADRLDRLIQDVLNYSRSTRGEMPLENVDVENLTREIIECYSHWQEAGATILIQSPMASVVGNRAALTQCVSNLLSNAVKFVAPGTKPNVRIWAEPNRKCVRLWFEDNGIGISEEGQKRIFYLFQRLNPTTEFEGTGIGLTIVRKAVERMGGRIGVESKVGVGSRFWLELKRAD